MIRKPPRGLQAGMVETTDVEGGETGEAPMSSTSGGDTTQYGGTPYEGDYEVGSTDAGTTSGAGTLQLEVEILAADAVDQVAREIARRVAGKASENKIRSVTVASPTLIAFLRLHSALEAEVAALEAMAKRLAAAAGPAGPVQTSDQSALADVAVEVAETARKAVKSATAALGSFAVSTKYSGRTKIARQTVLDAALARHLSLKKLEVEVPEHALPSSEPRGLFARLLELQSRCRGLQDAGADAEAMSPIVSSVESLLNLVFGTAENAGANVPIAQQLMMADGIARGMVKGRAVLFAEIAFSGGSYRTRKWILNFLFGTDGLTYSGGAGVTYFLFRGDDRATLDSDTLYFASPHGRFHHDRSTRFHPTNIGMTRMEMEK